MLIPSQKMALFISVTFYRSTNGNENHAVCRMLCRHHNVGLLMW